MTTIHVAPPNSQLILTDALLDKLPGFLVPPITVGRYGVVIPTLMEYDGDTEVTIDFVKSGGVVPPLPAGLEIVFDGIVETPSRHLVLTNVLGAVYWKSGVDTERTRLRVATDHKSEPERIQVVVGPVR